jgi:hypothetical protein
MTRPSKEHESRLLRPQSTPFARMQTLSCACIQAQLFTRDKRSRHIRGGIFRLEYDRLRYTLTPRREGIESPVTSHPVRSGRLGFSGVSIAVSEQNPSAPLSSTPLSVAGLKHPRCRIKPDSLARHAPRHRSPRNVFSASSSQSAAYESLSNTALHRSWMLAERAFGQLASVCSRSVSFASPCRSMVSLRRRPPCLGARRSRRV